MDFRTVHVMRLEDGLNFLGLMEVKIIPMYHMEMQTHGSDIPMIMSADKLQNLVRLLAGIVRMTHRVRQGMSELLK